MAGPFSSEAFALGSVYQPILRLAGPLRPQLIAAEGELAKVLAPSWSAAIAPKPHHAWSRGKGR